jgi:uncharacterized membrane protein YkvA (DUF1232 family)
VELPGVVMKWRERAQQLRADTYALYSAARDPRVPWYAKAVAGAVAAYAVSPIDLIPDFIPVLGLLDDLVIVPLGIVLVARLIPRELMDEHRRVARERFAADRPKSWVAATVVLVIWVLLLFVMGRFAWRFLARSA